MAKPFAVSSKEQGRGKASTDRFATLKEVQDYIKARWQGVEYKDGPASFHTDYCTYECKGFVLADIGNRLGMEGDDFWEWVWKPLP